MTRDKLLELLNNDLSLEYTGAIQYTQHQGVMRGAAFQSIQEGLVEFAKDNLENSIVLSMQIAHLDGFPTAKCYEAKADRDNFGMLRQDLEIENDAIARYSMRIKQTEEMNLFDLSSRIRKILAKKQEHAILLENALGEKNM